MEKLRQSGPILNAGTATGLSTFQELCQFWLTQPYREVPVNNVSYLAQNTELQLLFNCSPCLFWILDLRTLMFAYTSPRVAKITGHAPATFTLRGISFLDSIMHPEDRQPNWQRTKENWDKVVNLSSAERKQFSFTNTYRLFKPDGSFVRLLEQNAIWQLDSIGNITHILSIASDITHLDIPEFSITTPEPAAPPVIPHFSMPNVTLPKCLLSKRELQILRLMASGLSSKHIAEMLYISFHTVNTHRQKMIEKTKSHNTTGVIQYAINQGLL